MVLSLSFAVAILAFLPRTNALTCGDEFSDYETCYPGYAQTAHCCDYDSNQCCYDTNVAALWWFWVLLIFGILFTVICIRACCVYSRGYSRTGYVVVQGQTIQPTATVIQSNQATQVASAPVYPHSYHGYNPTVNTAAPKHPHGLPPPYAPPPQQQW